VEQSWPELKDFDVSSWVCVLAPAGTPAPIVARWNRELNRLLTDRDFQNKLKTNSLAVLKPSTPAEISALIKAETVRWGKVVREAKIEADN
jgi:tripartite-type tricarboxylate transporter receptor subunit TctC